MGGQTLKGFGTPSTAVSQLALRLLEVPVDADTPPHAATQPLPMATAAGASPTDPELIDAYRNGDATAFETIFARYERRLRGLCWTYVHDAELADDLVQDTFCKLIETADRVDPAFNVSAWLHRIAINLCLDELRRRQRHQLAHDNGSGDQDTALLRVVDPDRQSRPDEALEMARTRTMVWEALRRVPERQRQVLVLRDVHGQSHRAIGSSLDLAPGAVQGILHRARERFKLEFVALDGLQPAGGECAKVGFLLHTLGRRRLRRDRLKSVERHVLGCDSCNERFADRSAVHRPSVAPKISA